MTHTDSVRLWQGSVSIGAMPDEDTLTSLYQAGYTHIGCCLTDAEVPDSLPARARHAGLQWTWLPFTHHTLSEPSDTHYLRQYLSSLRQLLRQNSQIYLFCDGQKTRCVLLAYALCLNAGMPASSAYNMVCTLAGRAAHQTPRTLLQAVSQLRYYG